MSTLPKFAWPSGFDPDQLVTSEFGPRRQNSPFLVPHEGLDFAVPRGTFVTASGWGEVVLVHSEFETERENEGEGNSVWVRHSDRLQTRYLHLDSVDVEEGDFVTLGGKLGTVGDTGNASGPHLCFQTLVDGVAFNPRTWMRDRLREEAWT